MRDTSQHCKSGELDEKSQPSERPIRVAHVLGIVAKGGIESIVFNYYKLMDKSKVQFDFIVHDDSPFEIPDDILKLGCNVYKVPSYKHLPSHLRALKKVFKQGGYKIVHSHMSTISVLTLFAAKRAGIPIRIAHGHGATGKSKGEFFRNILKYILRLFSKLYPTHLFACSAYSGKWLFGKNAYKKGKITVINNAINTSLFVYNEEIRSKVRTRLGLSGRFVVGHVGRFLPQKNHSFLIDIFNEIYKKDNSSILLLVGDGALRAHIEDKVKDMNLCDNVLFLGGRDDANEFYQAMDVFVMPSLYEGLPVVLVEAQMAALFSVASNKINDESKFSDYIDFMDLNMSAEAWADRALEKRGAERFDMSGQLCAEKFDIDKEALKLENIYIRLISGEA